jgi:hypothetical protein
LSFVLHIVAKLLCSCLCLLMQSLSVMLSMKKTSMTLSVESESGIYIQQRHKYIFPFSSLLIVHIQLYFFISFLYIGVSFPHMPFRFSMKSPTPMHV